MNTYEVDKNNQAVSQSFSESLDAPKLATEIWSRDPINFNLWHGPHGVIVNTAALNERKAFYEIITQEAS